VGSCNSRLRHTTLGTTPLITHRPLRDNTQHSQGTHISAPSEIRIHNPSKRAAADPRRKPRGYFDRAFRHLVETKYSSELSFDSATVRQLEMFARQNSAYKSRMSAGGGPSVFCNISFPSCTFSINLETKTHNVLLLGPPTAYPSKLNVMINTDVWSICSYSTNFYVNFRAIFPWRIISRFADITRPALSPDLAVQSYLLPLGLRQKPAMRNTPCQKR
jgi:hypothetical protein